MIFLVICLGKSIVGLVRAPLAYRSNALGVDGRAQVLDRQPNPTALTVNSVFSPLTFISILVDSTLSGGLTLSHHTLVCGLRAFHVFDIHVFDIKFLQSYDLGS